MSRLIILFTFINTAFAFKVVTIDTHFCPKSFKHHSIFDATNSFNGANYCKSKKESHYQSLLQSELKYLIPSKNIELNHIVVVDKLGKQTKQYWKNALAKIEDIRPDLVISATQFPTSKDPLLTLPSIPTIFSAATIGKGVNFDSKLWPESYLSTSNSFNLIGEKIAFDRPVQIITPNKYINKSKINMFLTNSTEIGTSRSLYRFFNRIITRCNLLKFNANTCFKESLKN